MFGYQNPLAGLRQQLEKQLQDLDAMEQQAMRTQQPTGVDAYMQNVVRQEVDRYLNERQQSAPAQPENPMAQITGAIESVLPGDDVKFLAENIGIMPEYLRSAEGKGLLEKMVKGMRKHGENAVATQSGTASG
jgi:DNA-nicking Smr family endonuclease